MSQVTLILAAIAVMFGGLALAGSLDSATAIFGFAALAMFVAVISKRMHEHAEPPAPEVIVPAESSTDRLRQVVSTLPDPAIALGADSHVVL
ncbi:MAG: hypothetical protein ACR2PM_18355, partial [Hyphomicrobiales bacterium]